jgi:CheY-like chemotaxis protein
VNGGEDGTAGREVTLSVSDSGDGISQEFLPRVFVLFAQGNSPSSPAGLGIGLALARRLIEMQGGTIDVRSEGRGLGSEFVIRMPLSNEFPKTPSEAGAGSRVDCRVLVIDDNRDAADALAMLIEEIGGNCRSVYDGEAGMRELLQYRPDVVLLDIAMQELDGFETCRRIRQQLGDDVMLVAVTGFVQQHDKEEARSAGFDEHLTKPADPVVLQRPLAHRKPMSG